LNVSQQAEYIISFQVAPSTKRSGNTVRRWKFLNFESVQRTAFPFTFKLKILKNKLNSVLKISGVLKRSLSSFKFRGKSSSRKWNVIANKMARRWAKKLLLRSA